MSGVFFDSNVLLYTLVRDDPRATVAGGLLLEGGPINVQVLNEVVNVACRAPVSLTLATNTAALALAERHQLPFYDAFIVASAPEAGCATLLSENLYHGLVVDDRLVIQNPFQDVSARPK